MPGTDTTPSPRTNGSFTVGNNSERKTRTGRERAREGEVIHFLHRTKNPPHCPIKRTAQWYIRPAAAAIRGVGNSTILWASERGLSAYVEAHHGSSRYCPETGSANLQTRRGYFNPWQAGRDKWGRLQSSPALDVAVPALLLVRLGHIHRGADVVRQVGPEPLGFLQLPFDVENLRQEPEGRDV